MGISCYGRGTLVLALAAATLAGCGTDSVLGPNKNMERPTRLPGESSSQTFRTIFEFGGANGSYPTGLTIWDKRTEAVNGHGGELYGAARVGGSKNSGLFFGLTTNGVERVIHNFSFGNLQFPDSVLTQLNGRFYGTAYGNACGAGGGSANYCGLVFSVSKAGRQKVLHQFTYKRQADGTQPSNLAVLDGTLYGTTEKGGTGTGCFSMYSCGTVFQLTVSGKYRVLHSFQGPLSGGEDGAGPYGPLAAVNGTLYGATINGGTSGGGTVYSITPSGEEHILYSFGTTANDGQLPESGLVVLKGKLYGTTYFGGVSGCPYANGCGTVFTITTDGKYRVLYRFRGGTDGAQPQTALTVLDGTLYGTTLFGGDGCGNPLCGTLFSITTSGKEQVLYRFQNGADGKSPNSALTPLNGTLYGTAQYGTYDGGTAFALTP
jgi:uncharacterized repeat protein (TIGR03803 family)